MEVNKTSEEEHIRVNYRPYGAVECTECEKVQSSGGRLRLRKGGEVIDYYDALVCEMCKMKVVA